MNIILFNEGENCFDRTDERYQHLKKVLNCTAGSVFKSGIVNGKSGTSRILEFSDEGLSFDFTAEEEMFPLFPITLILAQVRPICMRRILREVVSLGVARILLTSTDLGEKSYLSSNLYTGGLYKGILLNGAMQSGKTSVSEVGFYKNVDDVVKTELPETRLLLDPKGSTSLARYPFKEGEIALAIGPERGWSAREVELFEKKGFTSLCMGDRILRTETAVVAALSLALMKMNLI